MTKQIEELVFCFHMNCEQYQQYLTFKEAGRRIEAKAALDKFIAAFAAMNEKQQWVKGFLVSGHYGQWGVLSV